MRMPKNNKEPIDDREKIVLPEDFENIIERFNEKISFYILLVIGYCTGTRISEVCALTWEDINFQEKTLTINKQLLKKGTQWFFESTKTLISNRIISVGDIPLEILTKHKELIKISMEIFTIKIMRF